MPPTEACPKCNARVPAGARFCQVCGAHMTGAARKHKKPGRRSRGKTWLAIGLVVVLLAGAVAVVSGTLGIGGDSSASVATSDALKLMENMAGPMPAWMSSASKEVKTEYAWAVDHHDELQYFPCYCGCYDNAGHESNYECYFQHDGTGQITGYDQHAYGWQICLDITRGVRNGIAKGKSLTQIRKDIDRLYISQGLKAGPTPQPPVGR